MTTDKHSNDHDIATQGATHEKKQKEKPPKLGTQGEENTRTEQKPLLSASETGRDTDPAAKKRKKSNPKSGEKKTKKGNNRGAMMRIC